MIKKLKNCIRLSPMHRRGMLRREPANHCLALHQMTILQKKQNIGTRILLLFNHKLLLVLRKVLQIKMLTSPQLPHQRRIKRTSEVCLKIVPNLPSIIILGSESKKMIITNSNTLMMIIQKLNPPFSPEMNKVTRLNRSFLQRLPRSLDETKTTDLQKIRDHQSSNPKFHLNIISLLMRLIIEITLWRKLGKWSRIKRMPTRTII